jgi:signal peptidase II
MDGSEHGNSTAAEMPTVEIDMKQFRKRDMRWRTRLVWLLLILTIFVADRVTKAAVLANIPEGGSITIIPGWFYFTHVQNPGAAFGMFSSLPDGWREFFLIAVNFIAMLLVLIYSLRLPLREWLSQLGLHMIFAGAIGNVADRFLQGTVTDFILFRHEGWSFPAFNIADSAIVCGVGLLLLDILIPRKRKAEPRTDPAADAISAGVEMDLVGAKPLGDNRDEEFETAEKIPLDEEERERG